MDAAFACLVFVLPNAPQGGTVPLHRMASKIRVKECRSVGAIHGEDYRNTACLFLAFVRERAVRFCLLTRREQHDVTT